MQLWKPSAVLLVLLPLVGGCAAARLIERGDASVLAGEPDQAVRYYEQALQKKPELAREAKFVGRLNRARCLAAYEEGVALGQAGRWEEAVEKFDDSLGFDPKFEDARQALPQAKREASSERHRRALKLADEGKLDEAVRELQKALELDPENTDARQALESVGRKVQARQTRAEGLFDKALALMAEKRFRRASAVLAEAIKLNANHLPSRLSRHGCERTLEKATQTHSTGVRLMSQKRLDEAIATLQQVLDIWPFHQAAPKDLAAAKALRAEAREHHERAVKLAEAARWDEAAAASAASLEIYPFHKPAVELSRRVRHEAARAHCNAGQGLMNQGKLAAARAEFLICLDHVPDFAESKQALGRIYELWGQAAGAEGLWGNALLWYLESGQYHPTDDSAARVRAAREKILGRIAFALAVDATDASGMTSASASVLELELLRRLSSRKPGFISLVSGATGLPAYDVAVRLARLEVHQHLVRRENRTHHYSIRRHVANPEIPKLRGLLMVAERELARMMRPCLACKASGRRVCPNCRGRGPVRCGKCEGTGKARCRPCDGTGWKKGDKSKGECPKCKGTGKAKCASCRGTGKRPCPTCSKGGKRRGWLPCRRCGGTGRASAASAMTLARKQHELRSLRDRLRSAPAMVARDFPADWSYVVEHYEKTGAIDAGLRVTRRGGTAAVAASALRKTFRRTDSTIDNANPGIGLAADALRLPSDAQVRRQLLGEAASDASARVLSAVLSDRIIDARRRAAALTREGKMAAAVEARADLVHLLGAHNPAEAARTLRELRDEQRRRSGEDVKAAELSCHPPTAAGIAPRPVSPIQSA